MEEVKDDFFVESRKELEQYVQNRILLLKMQAAEKTARVVALLFSVLIIALLSFFILLFLSIMAGYYFASITGSLFTGFGIVAGFYVLILTVLIFTRERISKKIIDTVISVFFDKTDDDDETS
jgi:uncharacterized membrane protein YdjX (TVP38/TMEM64 family)